MTKILLITLEYPPQKGGVASYYFGLVEELKRQGFDVEVIATPEVEPLLYRWIWPCWLRACLVLKRAIKKTRPDLIFVGQILPLGTAAYLLRKKVPYVVFTHGMDVLSARKSWRKRMIMKKVLEHAKLVVTNSEFTKNQMLNVKCQMSVVYPCPNIMPIVDQEDVELLRRRLGLAGKKVLLTLGRVVERKGQDLVLRALPEILKHIPNVVYVVAGAGPYLGKLAKLAEELNLGTAVRFVGEILDQERGAYFAMSDLFIMPCRQIGADVEGFGTVFLEAALFGKTSIGGNSGGVPEAILNGKTGVLVDPNDVGELARVAVQLLRNDELRQEFGNNAKARVLHEFTWEKQAGVLINTIDHIINE